MIKSEIFYEEVTTNNDFAKMLQVELIKKDKEIEQLNNIINEFDKWLIGEKMMFYKSNDGERLIRFGETKYKWLELKENGNNE